MNQSQKLIRSCCDNLSYISDIKKVLYLSQSNASHPLKILRKYGIVTFTKEKNVFVSY